MELRKKLGNNLGNAKDSFNKSLKDTKPTRDYLFDDDALVFPALAVACAICCILCPIRTCLKNFLNTNAIDESKVKYREKATTFSECYDKSNPLSSKKGTLRLIGLQIDSIEASVGAVAEGTELTDAQKAQQA